MVSLGCAKNLVDSELLMKQLQANNFQIIFDPIDASGLDTAVINTCGFIGDAKKESIDTIFQFVNAKLNGKIKRVYVMGCLSERYKLQLSTEIPEVDAFFGVNDLKKIVEHIGGEFKKELVGDRLISTPGHYAYLKIAEGCNRKCSFCAIPMIRGKHLSRPVEDIIGEAQKLVKTGIREINVISQDTTYYGLDLYKKQTLPKLLEALAQTDGLEWIRLHYTYPAGFPPDLLDVIRNNPKICRYIDIPLQHISDRILGSMRRGITAEDTKRLIDTIRNKIPGVSIRTTFIVGYPGETTREFNELRKFIETVRFDRMGVFTYSPEEDTHSYGLKDNVSMNVKLRRAEELMTLQEGISLSLNSNKVGEVMKVIVDRAEGDYFIARSEFDSPEVDNEVLINSKSKSLETGTFCNVRITKAESFDLYAELT
jgi:ribosomal protein S12 methylthiotransferase